MDASIIHDQIGKNGFVWFHGVVEDVNDPMMMGRVRVRCFGFHTGDKILLPTEDLPWATPLQPITSAAVSGKGRSPTGVLTGAWVVGFFRDGINCQDPIILGTFAAFPQPDDITGKMSNPEDGFNDPDGKYPSEDYAGEPDTNRLVRNETIDKTIVKTKRDSVERGVNTALAGGWTEPQTPYAAKYPKNHVMESEAGHIIEIDDTEGAERISIYHKAGTWSEIHPDGKKVEKVKSDNYEIVAKNNHILIKGNCDLNIDGASKHKVGKDLLVEIAGDAKILVNGSIVMETKKDFVHKVGGTYTVASGGNMLFVAPRIDFNPEGVAPGAIITGLMSSGAGAGTQAGTGTLAGASTPAGVGTSVSTVSSVASTSTVTTVTSSVAGGGIAASQATQLDSVQAAAQQAQQSANPLQSAAGGMDSGLNSIVSGIGSVIEPLQSAVGGVLGGIGQAIGGAVSGLGVDNIGAGAGPLNMGSLLGVGGAVLGGAGAAAPISSAIGGIGGGAGGLQAGGLLGVANQGTDLGAMFATNSAAAGAQTQTALPPVAAGLAGQNQPVTSVNLQPTAAPGLPTQSLYAVQGGKATLITGYPGKAATQLNDPSVGSSPAIPAVPIVAYETNFPSDAVDQVDGGEFA